ncbi:MAG TPA: carboxypeptidase-like regulatory domain-containing protein [Bryobacteraceae bacterium]|nr:carboxypeptidase-like regulatory domain-containing protein [Bryobacteraceae bacterium]
MRHLWFSAIALAAILSAAGTTPPKVTAKLATSASGVLVGRSGKPLANARIFLGSVEDDEEMLMAKIKLSGLPVAQTDAQGRFKLTGFVPGNYTIVYYPAGGPSFTPAEISIKALSAVDRSILPQLKNVEIGTTMPLDERKWASFTLLKGHTFWSQGTHMKIWNATLRKNPTGPYLEVRRGVIWRTEVKDGTQIRMDAWSY